MKHNSLSPSLYPSFLDPKTLEENELSLLHTYPIARTRSFSGLFSFTTDEGDEDGGDGGDGGDDEDHGLKIDSLRFFQESKERSPEQFQKCVPSPQRKKISAFALSLSRLRPSPPYP